MAVRGRWLAVAGMVLAWGAAAHAGSAPALHARAETDGVHLRWSYGSPSTPAATLMHLERSADGTSFAPLVTVQNPHRRQTWVDDAPGGTWWYRARVEADADVSAWSKTVSVAVTGGSGGGGGGSTGGGGTGDPPLATGQRECPTGSVEDVLVRVNATRDKQHLPPLHANAALAHAARAHTIDMAKAHNLSHTGWIGYVRAAGYTGGFLAENIAYGYQSSASVVQGWLDSPGHHANIVGGYRDTGVGCVIDGAGRYWWTEDFGA
jgi:hypothetical protein